MNPPSLALLVACCIAPMLGACTRSAAPDGSGSSLASSQEMIPPGAKPPAEPRSFIVTRRVDAGANQLVGRITLDSSYVISILPDEPVDPKLQKLVDDMNGRKTLNVHAPCSDGAPRYALCSQVLERTDDRFLDAIAQEWRTYEDLELTTR